jgi:hypothetical protein
VLGTEVFKQLGLGGAAPPLAPGATGADGHRTCKGWGGSQWQRVALGVCGGPVATPRESGLQAVYILWSPVCMEELLLCYYAIIILIILLFYSSNTSYYKMCVYLSIRASTVTSRNENSLHAARQLHAWAASRHVTELQPKKLLSSSSRVLEGCLNRFSSACRCCN